MSSPLTRAIDLLDSTALWLERYALAVEYDLPIIALSFRVQADELRKQIARLERNAERDAEFLLCKEDRDGVLEIASHFSSGISHLSRRGAQDRNRERASLLVRIAGLGPRKEQAEVGQAFREEGTR